MKKIAVEILYTAGERVTVILPDNLDRLEILGIANELLISLGLPSAKIVVGAEHAIAPTLEHTNGRTNCL